MARRINLALQGGGAHGAFTWGALDRLLEESDVEIAAISGTSAGALNGAALKAGLVSGGRKSAQDALTEVWQSLGATPDDDVAQFWGNFWSPAALAAAIESSPLYQMGEATTRLMSPYLTQAFSNNPLSKLLSNMDFELICASDGPEFFVGATNVRTGKVRVFEGDDITPQAILASACLPTLFPAVEIDDPKTGRREAYWDGGYTGNPALFPLFKSTLPDDIVIVNINPIERRAVPVSPQDIQNRINEISFNSALLRDLRAIAFVKRLIAEGVIEAGRMKDVNIHMIADDALMNDLNVATKTVPNPVIISELFDAGRAAANRWLSDHEGEINRASSVDLTEMFS